MASAVDNPTALRSVLFIMATLRETILSVLWCRMLTHEQAQGQRRGRREGNTDVAIQAIFIACRVVISDPSVGVNGPLRRNGTPPVSAIDATRWNRRR
jgi:hypothetical protein